MTRETLELLKQLLSNQQLCVGDPEFPELSIKATEALRELNEALRAEQGEDG